MQTSRMTNSTTLIISLRWIILVLLIASAGCATRRPAPVEDRVATAPPAVVVPAEVPADAAAAKPAEAAPRIHVVQKGETLIAIALQHGLDYKELAAWNYIGNANVIQVGQELRIAAPGAAPVPNGVVATPLTIPGAPVATPLSPSGTPLPTEIKPGLTPSSPVTAGGLKTEPRALKVPYSDKALAELEAEARSAAPASTLPAPIPVVPPVAAPTTAAKADDEAINWSWPAKGKLLASYTEGSKGIDIGGALGAPVLAAAGGKVMYSGTGIRGYGKLVIIKHNNSYLSAYAHNNSIVVKEGQDVKKGEKIAEMGSSDADQVKLHFEIRKQGKPIDPAKLLPAS